ncbi:MAG: YcgL domain-containing protein [Gammaproteobacteria bacterium]|nr:YcgL domain-containing protein [Gammaproteobacteria bacterium]
MNSYIYRCSAKHDMYIYLAEKDHFDCIPDELKKSLGQLTFTMELEIDKERKLAREKPEQVINNLKGRGFHLQLPSETSVEELMARIAQQEAK